MLRSWLQPTRIQRYGDLRVGEGERRLPAGVHARPDALGELDGARSWLPRVALDRREVRANQVERVERAGADAVGHLDIPATAGLCRRLDHLAHRGVDVPSGV